MHVHYIPFPFPRLEEKIPSGEKKPIALGNETSKFLLKHRFTTDMWHQTHSWRSGPFKTAFLYMRELTLLLPGRMMESCKLVYNVWVCGLLTHKNSYFGAISVKDQNCTVPRLCRQWSFTDGIGPVSDFFAVWTGILIVQEVNKWKRALETTEIEVNMKEWGL